MNIFSPGHSRYKNWLKLMTSHALVAWSVTV